LFTPPFFSVFLIHSYVLAVGATQGPENGSAEIACMPPGSIITTGGGFSTRLPRPSYQDAFVKQYLTSAPDLPPLRDFAWQGRAYPDVAALGNAFIVVIGGQSYEARRSFFFFFFLLSVINCQIL
jgi:hypothetical protein